MLSPADYLPTLYGHIERYVQIDATQKEQLASVVKVKRLLKRQYLLQEGAISQYESFVVSGCLRTFYMDIRGVEHTLSFAVEDWWTSDLESFLKAEPSMYNIEALEACVVLQINKTSLDLLYNRAPSIERYFRILHENAFIAQSKRILQNISMTGEDRFEAFLSTYPQWHQRIPQKYIATYLGITPVFLSQIRSMRSGKKAKN